MFEQPGGDGFDGAVGEQGNGQAQLQITNEGSVAQSALARPVIQANDAWFCMS
jgi:hypothetical protein